MHEKIIAKIDLNFPDDYDVLTSKEIEVGKNLLAEEVEAAVIEYLANTNFSEHSLYDFGYETDTKSITQWIAECQGQHSKLTVENPECDEHLHIGTFKSDHKYAGHAVLLLVYERRYLENE